MLLPQIVIMDECGEEYMVGKGKSHCKEVEDPFSSATSPRHGSTDLHRGQYRIVPWFTIQAVGYSHPGEL